MEVRDNEDNIAKELSYIAHKAILSGKRYIYIRNGKKVYEMPSNAVYSVSILENGMIRILAENIMAIEFKYDTKIWISENRSNVKRYFLRKSVQNPTPC